MNNCRPAGMSSDEDNSDEDYDFSGFTTKKNYFQNVSPPQPTFLSPEEELFDAISSKNFARVNELVAKGVDLKALENNWTPLMLSCFNSSPDIVKLLVDNGSDIHFHKDYFTPLMAVCTNSFSGSEDQKVECVKILLDHSIDINAADRFRTTALMHAAREGLNKVVTLLINRKCNLNKQDKDGWTALFHAVYSNRLDVIDTLFASGINLEIKDMEGQTAYELALSKGNEIAASKVILQKPFDELEPPLFIVPPVLTIKDMMKEMPSKNTGKNPGFSSDVYFLLLGMDMQVYAEKFYKNNVQLGEFLLMTDDDLKEVGVKIHPHRQKILVALKRFHHMQWHKTAVGLKPKSETIDLIDGVKLLGNAVRQMHVLQSTLHYLQVNKDKLVATDELKRVINKGVEVSERLEEEALRLQKFGKHIDKVKPVRPVDLIKNEEDETRVGLFKISLGCIVGAYIIWKYGFFRM